MTSSDDRSVGIVVIGRNEGERLRRCLASLPARVNAIYVDSGSTDDSVALAASRGLQVIALDTGAPFTAARARNTGIAAFGQAEDAPDFVLTLDGDCELDGGFLDAAIQAMHGAPRLAVAFGRLRERFPKASIYNEMCDDEWNVPVGPARASGGNALFRRQALVEAGGFDPSMIAGEEPDLCARLRQRGWQVERIDAEMALHDAAITRFGQWARRTMRSGHAFAQLADRHGRDGDRHWWRPLVGIIFWAGAVPLTMIALTIAGLAGSALAGWGALVLAFGYVAQLGRIALRGWRDGLPGRFALQRAFFLMIGKFMQLRGVSTYLAGRLAGRTATLIEYKGAS